MNSSIDILMIQKRLNIKVSLDDIVFGSIIVNSGEKIRWNGKSWKKVRWINDRVDSITHWQDYEGNETLGHYEEYSN